MRCLQIVHEYHCITNVAIVHHLKIHLDKCLLIGIDFRNWHQLCLVVLDIKINFLATLYLL